MQLRRQSWSGYGVYQLKWSDSAPGNPFQRMIERIVGVVEDDQERSSRPDYANDLAESAREIVGNIEMIECRGRDYDVERLGCEWERSDIRAKAAEIAANLLRLPHGSLINVDPHS